MANSVGENLRAFLLTQTGVTAIAGPRVCKDHVPMGTLDDGPYVAFKLDTTRRETCHDDAVGARPFGYTFQLESVAETEAQCAALWQAVADALNLAKGTFGDSTVQLVKVEDGTSNYEPFSVSADTGLYFGGYSVQVIP